MNNSSSPESISLNEEGLEAKRSMSSLQGEEENVHQGYSRLFQDMHNAEEHVEMDDRIASGQAGEGEDDEDEDEDDDFPITPNVVAEEQVHPSQERAWFKAIASHVAEEHREEP